MSSSTLPVLVTGACGHIAGQIVRKLVTAGRKVLATDRLASPGDADVVAARWGENAAQLVEFVQAELTDGKAVRGLVERSSAVVHVGAVPGPSKTPPPGVDPSYGLKAPIGLEGLLGVELLEQNLIGTSHVIEAAAEGDLGRRVVFSSSLFAMGWSHDPTAFVPDYLPLDEDHPPMPCEHYGLSKAFCEDLARMLVRAAGGSQSCGGGQTDKPTNRFAGKPTFISLRFSNIVKQEKWGELPWSIDSRPPLTPLMWTYTHEHDVVDAHLQALDLPAEQLPSQCESFLIVAQDTRMDIETEKLIAQHSWSGGKAPHRKVAMPGYASIVSMAKARHILGFNPRSFREVMSPGPEPQASPSDPSLVTAGDGSGRTWSIFKAPPDFVLHSGKAFPHGFIAYKTYGTLNSDASNAILHPVSFDACHWELEFNVGPGKMLDTSKDYIVIVNLLGNGVSFSPSSSEGREYPICGATVCDNVRLQALLLDSLGIKSLVMIYGYSMGALQALHWGVMFPERVQRIAALCGAARCSDYNAVFLESLESALYADPSVKVHPDGRRQLVGHCGAGLRAFGKIYAGWAVSLDFYRQEVWKSSARDGKPFTSREDFVERSYVGGFSGGHPLNLLAQVDTWKQADVSKAHGLPSDLTLKEALGRIRAEVLFMPCTTDRYFTVEETREQSECIPRCRFEPIPSAWGHRAGDPHRPGQEVDAAFIQTRVAELLAKPAP